jgi:exopolysaccharide production protein ExoQ
MSSNNHSLTKPTLPVGRPPWLVFLFITTVSFFIYNDLLNAANGIGNYDGVEDTIVGAVAEGSASRRVALVSLAIFAIVILIRHRANVRLRIQDSLGWILLGFAALAFASPIWAEDRLLTLTRVAVFAILCIAAVAVVHRFSVREIILWAFFTSGSYLVIGVVAEALFGTFRPFASGYRFAGTLHPNNEGINCALLLLSGLAAADVEKQKKIIYRICALVGFVFLVLTASRTAFASALLALAVYLGAVCSKRTKIVMAYALSIVFCVLLMGLGNAFLPDLKSAVMLGRDDSTVGSFNGRTGVWDEISHYVQRRPILGYGYGGFWTPAHISEISEGEKWGIPNSHSAYLDNLLMLGAVGLVGYVLLLFAGIRSAFRFYSHLRGSAFAFFGAFLVFCALDGLLESAPIEPSLLMFLSLVVLIYLSCLGDLHPHRFANLSRGAATQPARN